MTQNSGRSCSIHQRRGSWLRYFLAIWASIAVFALAVPFVDGQITVERPIRLAHAYGYVLTERGKPVAGVQVALVSGGPPPLAMNTDLEGNFDFPGAKGEYLLHVKIPGSAIAARQVIVGRGFRALFHHGPLYVMINPNGACSDCTSPIFASKKEFDRGVRENARTTN
jgi:hypothetical protein